ncbi:MAG TPA: hypothetical protein VM261_35620 [Kofleriaceae bacterium]|nr:hypothetical protein [Kofleriaceae bacterium]
MRRALAFVVLGALAACGSDLDVDGDHVDAAVDPDPLAVEDTPDPGSFDDLHRTIIAPRCSGQPGLCHNGQFEPNLSTPGNAYAYLVGRPALEKPTLLRVNPGNPATSVLVDKLRNRGVATRMPLGADPLEESQIAAVEAWISGGALRRPGARPAPMLNNPPRRPEIAIYAANGARLDIAGPVTVSAGATITLRHSVRDFETPDAQIPFGAFVLQAPDGRSVVFNAAATMDPHVGVTTYDAGGPMGTGDVLNYQRAWTIPSTITLYDEDTNMRQDVPAAGLTLTIICVYLDAFTSGIATIEIGAAPITIQ